MTFIRALFLLACCLPATALAQAVMSFSPGSLSFGNRPVGSASPNQVVTVTNTGTSTLNVTGLSFTTFDYPHSTTCLAAVAPGGTCTITVACQPTTTGPRPDTGVVTSNASNSPGNIPVSCTGVSASPPTLSPASLNFGTVPVGTPSSPQVLTLSNPVTSSTLTMFGVTPSAGYSHTSNCASTVAPGASCQITVTFTPTTSGPNNGSIVVNTSNGNATANLTGTGASAPVGTPSLLPSAFNFNLAQVGTQSAPQVFTFSNPTTTSGSALTISVAAPFTQTNNCGPSLQANQVCQITVRFAPTLAGPAMALLTLQSGSINLSSSLSGTGTSAPVVTPSGVVANVSPRSASANVGMPSAVAITYTFAPNTLGAQAVDAVFCSALSTPVPASGASALYPCSPGSEFARHPTEAVNFQTMRSGPYVTSARESIRIPASVSRAAYQRAQQGAMSGTFYFVRRFAPESYAIVEVRLLGNAANQPITITDARVGFQDNAERPLAFVRSGELVPNANAVIYYSGAGLLRGSWEVVQPGDIEPEPADLVPEASLPLAARGRQRTYTVVGTFEHYLPAVGRFVIPGPDPERLPAAQNGAYRLILRLKAAPAIGGEDPGLLSGGAAPFALPTARYFVGSTPDAIARTVKPVILDRPFASQSFRRNDTVRFGWRALGGTAHYRLEIGDGARTLVLSALLRPGDTSYVAPPFLRERTTGMTPRWRVLAYDADGVLIGQSAWRDVRFEQ